MASKNAILDAASFAVYQIQAGGEVTYANRLGQSRLGELGIQAREDEPPNLENVLLNYKHTPIYKGFQGIPSYNKAVTWITNSKTYEDITTIVPMERGEEQDRQRDQQRMVDQQVQQIGHVEHGLHRSHRLGGQGRRRGSAAW